MANFTHLAQSRGLVSFSPNNKIIHYNHYLKVKFFIDMSLDCHFWFTASYITHNAIRPPPDSDAHKILPSP